MNIPEGLKLVPVEPTVAMEDAAAPECYGYCPRCDTDMQIKTGIQVNIYRTMIDAAQTPPQPIFDEAKERELFERRIKRIAIERNYSFLSFLLIRDKGGEYRTTWVDMAWLGWSERAQSRAQSVEVGDE